VLEISLAVRAPAGSALDAAAAAQLLPRLTDAEATEVALQRHPLVRGASGLVCTGTAESRQAWCSMLRDLFSASGAAVSDAVLLRVYLVCKECARRGHVQCSGSAANTSAGHDASEVSETACKAQTSPKCGSAPPPPPPSLSPPTPPLLIFPSFQHTQKTVLSE
jgi:hypothetical protein